MDAVATYDESAGRLSVFAVNRSLDGVEEVEIELAGLAVTAVVEAWMLADADPFATNTLNDPDRVKPVAADTRVEGGKLVITLPPVSWGMVACEVGAA